jgi:hypothetical protein
MQLFSFLLYAKQLIILFLFKFSSVFVSWSDCDLQECNRK